MKKKKTVLLNGEEKVDILYVMFMLFEIATYILIGFFWCLGLIFKIIAICLGCNVGLGFISKHEKKRFGSGGGGGEGD